MDEKNKIDASWLRQKRYKSKGNKLDKQRHHKLFNEKCVSSKQDRVLYEVPPSLLSLDVKVI